MTPLGQIEGLVGKLPTTLYGKNDPSESLDVLYLQQYNLVDFNQVCSGVTAYRQGWTKSRGPKVLGAPSNVAKHQHACITKFTLRFTQLRHTLYPITDSAIFHFKVDLRTTLSFETVHRSIPKMSAKPAR